VSAKDVIEAAWEERTALKPTTALVSLMHANGEIGTLEPIAEVGRIARGRGVPFHVDAVGAAGRVALAVEDCAIDLLTVSSNDLYGPPGAGALWARSEIKLAPRILGGGQERGLRAGTEDVASAVGLARAVGLAVAEQESEAARLSALTARLAAGLRERLSDIIVFGEDGPRAPHILNVGVCGVDGAALLASLDLEGVAASSGSACHSGAVEASHVLRATHAGHDRIPPSLRFSVGRLSREPEIDRAIDVTIHVVERLRALAESPA